MPKAPLAAVIAAMARAGGHAHRSRGHPGAPRLRRDPCRSRGIRRASRLAVPAPRVVAASPRSCSRGGVRSDCSLSEKFSPGIAPPGTLPGGVLLEELPVGLNGVGNACMLPVMIFAQLVTRVRAWLTSSLSG